MTTAVAEPLARPAAFAVEGEPVGDSLAVRLACFVALAAYGAAHWAGLVADAPVWRTLLMVTVVTAGAAALALLPRTGLRHGAVLALAGVVTLVMFVLALMAAGLQLRLLGPRGWDELADGLYRGLEGIQTIDWPYAGPDEWIRLTILLGAPALLATAAALAFFPVRRGARALRLAGLVVLLVMYGTSVTEHDPGAPLLRGFVLLALVGAWLWLPRLTRREALTGAAVVASVGLLAVPAAASFDADEPWWNYREWQLFGGGRSVTFDWTHSYGPLDWPRDGTTLLNIKSSRPHYWKVETLDGFDGFRWLRTDASSPTQDLPGLPESRVREGRTWDYFEYNPRWDEQFTVTVRSLSSQLIVGAGITYRVEDAGVTSSSQDGTTIRVSEDPLERGDSYTVHAYAPDPTAAQMRGSPLDGNLSLLQFTTLALPSEDESALDGESLSPLSVAQRDAVQVPLRDGPAGYDPSADVTLRNSRYARAYRLAQRLTGGEASTYDAVKAVENHLQRGFRYSERPPSAGLPLDAFLFEDKIGYCQQFSGAMALLLRLSGIPARVVAGFSPGSFNRDSGEYRVRDLDAHSWVEVYFNGIGWVPFDPTPTAAPAESQSSGLGATSAAAGDAGEVRSRDGVSPTSERAGGADADGAGAGGGLPWWTLVLAALLAGAGALGYRRLRSRRDLSGERLVEAQLAELRRALVGLGYSLPDATTLLALERRLGRTVGPASAGYAAALRAHRFDPRAPRGPGPAERRALRRELTGRNPLARLRGLAAIPPGGPRPL
ncbi:MAG: transglutaminase domain-containing protein [Thermoleophilaceae bacterium]|nr:transglutaminase domain-containing protein [Thermoleophilaceae bacterium]